MSKQHFTVDQLKELATDYFTSNPDVEYLVASTHDGVFYRPENAGYAQAGADKSGGEMVKVTRESLATTMTSRTVNVNINHLAVHSDGQVADLAVFFYSSLARVANGEEVEKVLADMLAAGPKQEELTWDLLPESYQLPFRAGLDEVVADALYLPGFFTEAEPAQTPASTEPEVEPAKTPEAAEAAPVAKKPRVAAAPKKPAAKSPKPKTSTKAA